MKQLDLVVSGGKIKVESEISIRKNALRWPQNRQKVLI
jgi:hypothetical protein